MFREFISFLLTPVYVVTQAAASLLGVTAPALPLADDGTQNSGGANQAVTRAAGSTGAGSNTAPFVELMTISDTWQGPAADPIIVSPGTQFVYVHGILRDPDGCSQIDGTNNVRGDLYISSAGSCGASGSECVSEGYGSGNISVGLNNTCQAGQNPPDTDVDYQIMFAVTGAAANDPAANNSELWRAEVYAKDDPGDESSNSTTVNLVGVARVTPDPSNGGGGQQDSTVSSSDTTGTRGGVSTDTGSNTSSAGGGSTSVGTAPVTTPRPLSTGTASGSVVTATPKVTPKPTTTAVAPKLTPTPAAPPPAAPTPAAPTPDSPTPKTPTPVASTPAAPPPATPTPVAPTPDSSTPETPTPDAPDYDDDGGDDGGNDDDGAPDPDDTGDVLGSGDTDFRSSAWWLVAQGVFVLIALVAIVGLVVISLLTFRSPKRY